MTNRAIIAIIRVAILGMILAFVPLSVPAMEVSVGGEFAQGIGVQNVLIVPSGPFGIHLGGALDRWGTKSGEFEGTVFGAYGMFLLKYYLALGSSPIIPYIGAGFLMAAVDVSARVGAEAMVLFRGVTLGPQVVSGVEIRATNGWPVVLYAGLAYMDVPELSANLLGYTTSVPIASRGFTFHIGARLNFSF